MSVSLWNNYGSDNFSELDRMQREMNRLFSNALAPSGNLQTEQSWRPISDLKETDKEIIVCSELPGCKKEDIQIELKDGVLTISGERKHEKKEDTERYHRMERSYGKFSRSLAVPKNLTEDKIKASFKDGVLEVCFPKEEPTKKDSKRIAINSA